MSSAFKWNQDETFKWNEDSKDECGSNLSFEGSNIMTKSTGTNIANCTFGKEVNNTQCDVFTLDFKITHNNKNWLFIGYAIPPFKQSVPDMNDYPGNEKNSKNSFSFEIRERNDILRNGHGIESKIYQCKKGHPFKSNELFRLQFDFKNNEKVLYHGYKKIYKEKLLLDTKRLL